jgi:hypothetical protein
VERRPGAITYHWSMRCPACHAEVSDPEAVFCSRCGRRLAPLEDEATDRIDKSPPGRPPVARTETASGPRSAASPANPPPSDRSRVPASGETVDRADGHTGNRTGLMGEMLGAVRRSLSAGGWGLASSAAALGFLAVLAVGAAFIGVLKLYDPQFGAGRSPMWVLVRIVIAGLASLGIPVEQAGAEGAILPLGALALVGWTLIWAGRNVVAKSNATSISERVLQGAKVGVPFAIFVFFAALAFRVRDPIEVGPDPGIALLLGAFWGGLFGAVGGAGTGGGLRALIAELPASARNEVIAQGVGSGALMVVTGVALASAAVLVFLIVDLAVASDLPLAAGDALAIAFLLIAFAPNIAAGTLAFATGAPVVFVARSLGIGLTSKISLFGWGVSGAEWYLYPLILIPIVACLLGGYAARKKAADPNRFVEVIGVSACLFSVIVAVLAYVGGISLDRAFLGEGNLFVLSADPAAAFFLSFLFAALLGAAGWKVADSQMQANNARGQQVR